MATLGDKPAYSIKAENGLIVLTREVQEVPQMSDALAMVARVKGNPTESSPKKKYSFTLRPSDIESIMEGDGKISIIDTKDNNSYDLEDVSMQDVQKLLLEAERQRHQHINMPYYAKGKSAGEPYRANKTQEAFGEKPAFLAKALGESGDHPQQGAESTR